MQTNTDSIPLIFPAFEYKLTQKEGKLFIFDAIAKKFRSLSPEEWVRQHCLHFLTHHLHYPASCIQIEGGHQINSMQRRTDIQVFDPSGHLLLIIECKAPHVAISEQSLMQISQYQKKNEARYIALTNGLENHIFEINLQDKQAIKINQFPSYL
jgi:hypothetical protein